jgi:tetratricopeptide (TPR) repeat protein
MAAFDEFWDYGDPTGSETAFRSRLDSVASDADLHAQLLSQIARAQGLQRNFDAANATLEEAELLAPENSTASVRVELERGRVLNSSGLPTIGCTHFELALAKAKAIGDDGLAVDAAHMLGIASAPEERLTWSRRALELAKGSQQPDATKWLASLYNNIGWALHDEGNFQDALDMFEQALEQRKSQNRPKEALIAEWCIGRCLRSLGQNDEALGIQRDLEKKYEESPSGYVFEEIGELLLATEPKEASEYFRRAHEILSRDDWLAAEQPERLARLQSLGGS